MRALAVVAMAVLLTACGSSKTADSGYEKTPAATIDQDMRDALAGLTSVTVSTTSTASDSPFSMTATVDSKGQCTAKLSEGDQTLELIATSTKNVYGKATSAFWVSEVGLTQQLADQLAQRWVTSLPDGIYTGVCSLAEVVKPFTSTTIAKAEPKVLGTTTVAGVAAVNLQISMSGTAATVAVASAAPHYPLSVKTSDGKRTETLTAFNKPVTATAPANPVDLKQLSGSN